MLLLELRKVQKEDWDYILKIRNDKEFRGNFYNSDELVEIADSIYKTNNLI